MADLENSEKHLVDVLTRVIQRKVYNNLYHSLGSNSVLCTNLYYLENLFTVVAGILVEQPSIFV